MRWEQKVQYAALSDIGFRRRNNQDSSAVQICTERPQWEQYGHLFLVADGMGGHAVGELASKIAADAIPHAFFKSEGQDVSWALRRAIESANAAIFERGQLNRDFEHMGTTCTALVLSPKGAVIGHVGDSRVYRIRRHRIEQMTFDHSLQWELLQRGGTTAQEVYLHEPRHIITRSLGPEPKVKIDLEGPSPVWPGDTYVLCSDGLTNHVQDDEIGAVAGTLSPGEACRLLVNMANLRGGSDNVTVLIAHVGAVPKEASRDRPVRAPSTDDGPSWWWLAAFWGAALGFATGVSLLLFGRLVAGIAVTALAVMGLVTLAIRWWQTRRAAETDFGLAETTLSRPYRLASAKLTRSFLNRLAALESELQHTAVDEEWSIDWEQHEEAYRCAKTAVDAARPVEALAGYAAAIDGLMKGLYHHRRQKSSEQKRGRQTPPGGYSTAPQQGSNL